MSEKARRLYTQAFSEHVNFTTFDIRGDLLIIGPDENLTDLVPIIPHLDNISRIEVVSWQFGPRLKVPLELVLSAYQAQRGRNIEREVHTLTKFQELEKTYDRAVYFGSYPSFAENGQYRSIRKILNQGGIFYGTINRGDISHGSPEGCDTKLFKNIKPHPLYKGVWSGLVITKNGN